MQLIRTNKVREIASILINFTIAIAARVKQINTKSLCIWDLNTSPNGQEFSSTNAFNCDNLLGQIVGFYLNPSSNITHRVFISVPPPPFSFFLFFLNLPSISCCFWPSFSPWTYRVLSVVFKFTLKVYTVCGHVVPVIITLLSDPL